MLLVFALCVVGAHAGLEDLFAPQNVVDGRDSPSSGCPFSSPTTYVNLASQKDPALTYEDQCSELNGTKIFFNNPCEWASGQAELTYAFIGPWCKGQTRVLHWHSSADEWGYVKSGIIQAYVASPLGVPWDHAINNIGPGGVWYFPQGWVHGLMCLTPQSEGGCSTTLVFRSPVEVPFDNREFDYTFQKAPSRVGAQALGISEKSFDEIKSNLVGTPLMALVAPEVCDPECPGITETLVAPTAVNRSAEVCHMSDTGARICDIGTDQFQLATTLSQQRVELPAGALHPMKWCANCNGLLVVLSGNIQFELEGGLGDQRHPDEVNELYSHVLQEGDIAYLPISRAYWLTEVSGKASAEIQIVWNVGHAQLVEMSNTVANLPTYAIWAALNSSQNTPSVAKGPVTTFGTHPIKEAGLQTARRDDRAEKTKRTAPMVQKEDAASRGKSEVRATPPQYRALRHHPEDTRSGDGVSMLQQPTREEGGLLEERVDL